MDSVSDVLVRWYRNGAGKGGEDAGTTLENNTFNVTDIVNLMSENKRVEAVEKFNETFKYFDKLTFEDKLDAAYRLNNANLKDLAKKAVEKLRESFDKLKTTDQRREVVVADMEIVDWETYEYVIIYYASQTRSPELEDNIFRMIQCAVEMYGYIGMSRGKSGVHRLIKQMCILLAKTTMRFDMKIVKYLHANKLFSELDHYLDHTLTIRNYWTLDFSAVTENDVTYIQDLNPETLKHGKHYADALGRILQKNTTFNVTDIVNLMSENKRVEAVVKFNETFKYFDKLTFEEKLDAATQLDNARLGRLATDALQELVELFDKLETTEQRCKLVVAEMKIVGKSFYPYVAAYYERQELSPKLEADMFEMIKCMVNARNNGIGIISMDLRRQYGVYSVIADLCDVLYSKTKRFDMKLVNYFYENIKRELKKYLHKTLTQDYATVDFSTVTEGNAAYFKDYIPGGKELFQKLEDARPHDGAE